MTPTTSPGIGGQFVRKGDHQLSLRQVVRFDRSGRYDVHLMGFQGPAHSAVSEHLSSIRHECITIFRHADSGDAAASRSRQFGNFPHLLKLHGAQGCPIECFTLAIPTISQTKRLRLSSPLSTTTIL